MKILLHKIVFPVLFILLFPIISFAQETPPRTVDAPIDTFLFVLLGAGAVYGAIKMSRESTR